MSADEMAEIQTQDNMIEYNVTSTNFDNSLPLPVQEDYVPADTELTGVTDIKTINSTNSAVDVTEIHHEAHTIINELNKGLTELQEPPRIINGDDDEEEK
eukprot:376945_1